MILTLSSYQQKWALEKPDPAIFQLALDRWRALEAKDILYIGDHETNDIWAPNQVRYRCCANYPLSVSYRGGDSFPCLSCFMSQPYA